MDKFKISTEVFDRYMDASVELFMECYAETITINADNDMAEDCSPQLQDKCKALIKANHRRKKLAGFIKGSGRVLKSAAVLAIAFLSLSSFLFMTVEAVRTPILNFYIQKNDGNWELSNSPFGVDPNGPDHSSKGSFSEQDPLGILLPDNFQLHSIEGNLNDGLIAVYHNDDSNFIILECEPSDSKYHINTEDTELEQIKISGYDAVLSVRKDCYDPTLVWYISDLDMFLTLKTDCLSKNELINIAELLNHMFIH